FFSSRRRHTRFSRDWSSDVCSSDLNIMPILEKQYEVKTLGLEGDDIVANIATNIPEISEEFDIVLHAAGKAHAIPKTESEKQSRSEERRVGKEWRTRGGDEYGQRTR